MSTSRTWVSKTNLTDFLRCPYSFWLSDRGDISREDLISPAQRQLLTVGVDFETGIVSDAVALPMPPGGEAEIFRQDLTVVAVRRFVNERLRLVGRPDGLLTARGALEPVEIKSHRNVSHLDRLELGFYWLLLAPHRTRSSEPVGWLWLRQDVASFDQVRVRLTSELLEEVRASVADVRRARLEGIEPSACRCHVCAVLRRREVRSSVIAREHLSAIRDIGSVRVQALGRAGYRSWTDLIEAEAGVIVGALRAQTPPQRVSSAQVARWQAQARALTTGVPAWTATPEPFPVPSRYVALDLEYVAGKGPVWLAGMHIVGRTGQQPKPLWADDEAGEERLLRSLERQLLAHPELRIVTWNGQAADLPALRSATKLHHLPRLYHEVERRHIDLLYWTYLHLALPSIGLGLKDISDYFGLKRNSDIGGGLEAEFLWREHQDTKSRAIKKRLIAYNEDDVTCLVEVTEELRRIVGVLSGVPLRSG